MRGQEHEREPAGPPETRLPEFTRSKDGDHEHDHRRDKNGLRPELDGERPGTTAHISAGVERRRTNAAA